MQGTGGGRFAPLLFPLILLFKQQDLLVINNYLYTVAWGRGVLLEGHSTIILYIVFVRKVFGRDKLTA